MLADDRVGRIGQAKFLQARAAAPAGRSVTLVMGKTVQDDLFQRPPVEGRRDRLGKEA